MPVLATSPLLASGFALREASPGADGGNPFNPVVLVPTLYGTMQINDRLTAGIGINAPFGLRVDYKDGWFGRYDSLAVRVSCAPMSSSRPNRWTAGTASTKELRPR